MMFSCGIWCMQEMACAVGLGEGVEMASPRLQFAHQFHDNPQLSKSLEYDA